MESARSIIGTWNVGTAIWTASYASDPPESTISAVFLVAFDGDQVLAVRNERGWDLPGGHIEPGESAVEALRRETSEEAGATFERAHLFVVVSSTESANLMAFYLGLGLRLGPFTPAPDALDRRLMQPPELLGLYHGDRRVLASLLEVATQKLYSK
jgi:8-oxo-dGTP pyrophosphatase MutT (NUDIX family)